MTPDDIIAAARSELDTPFAHQGRIPGKKLDCAGLMIRVCVLLDVPFIDHGGYARRPSGGLLESALDMQPSLYPVPKSDMARGDILVFRFKGQPQHLAIFDGKKIIHAYEAAGKVCEHLLDPAWASRIVRAYRFNGVSA